MSESSQGRSRTTKRDLLRSLIRRDVEEKNLCGYEVTAGDWTETCLLTRPCPKHDKWHRSGDCGEQECNSGAYGNGLPS